MAEQAEQQTIGNEPETTPLATDTSQEPVAEETAPTSDAATSEVELDSEEAAAPAEPEAEPEPVSVPADDVAETDALQPDAGDAGTLIKTPSTDAVESVAAASLSSDKKSGGKSMFLNEGKAAALWLLFTGTYWTFVVWIPALINLSFIQPGFFGWCVGFIGIISSAYTLYEGKYPSGATKEDPKGTSGIGRYCAILLTGTVIVDFCVLALWGMLNSTSTADKIRGSCHLAHIFWTSLFFYGKFAAHNPEVALTAFFLEWVDMAMSCVVIFVLHNEVGDEGCFDRAICIVYFAYVVMELFGWMLPMMLIEGWGTGENAKVVSTHLFILDLVTDVMVMLAVLIEESYKINFFIKVDIIWKTCSVIRSFSYYAVYQVWLNKGRKVFKRTRGISFN